MATDDDAADGYISIDSSKDERGLTLLCSDFCQAPIFRNFVRGHLERTIAQFPAMSSLLYADWIPQWNGFAVSATI